MWSEVERLMLGFFGEWQFGSGGVKRGARIEEGDWFL